MRVAKIKRADVPVGDQRVADDGFTCLTEGRACTVCQDDIGLYVRCGGAAQEDGLDPRDWPRIETHRLAGQEDDDGSLIGSEYYVPPGFVQGSS